MNNNIDNKIKCILCKKNNKELNKYSVNSSMVCTKCNTCKLCIKQFHKNNLKKISYKPCNSCCHICKKCDKLLLKNNFPEDIIINDLCQHCNNLCNGCGRFTKENDLIHKYKKDNYCIKCFENKYVPKKNEQKYKYQIIKKEDNYGNLFLDWKKTHEKVKCSDCDKQFWKCIKFKKNVCKKCKKCKKSKKINSHNNSNNIKDPSDKNNLYKQIIQNKKSVWTIDAKRKKCFNCYNLLWIKIDNLKKGDQYFCQSCPPSKINKKLKYDKNKQKWVPYRIKINCTKCKKDKWIFVNMGDKNDKNKNKNKINKCKKCTSNSNSG